MKKNKNSDIIVIGFALFAMFFGAGNLIFPPYLGKTMGNKFPLASLGFVITGVGLPFLGIIACAKNNGSFETIAKRVGNKFAILYTTILFLAIGPMLAIPRTAATTYELAINPLIPGILPLISAIIYFTINLFFILRPSKIIDIIGKYLTPVLLITLSILIIKGIITPIGSLKNTHQSMVLSKSLIEGYQTMDAIGSLILASIIVSAVKAKGYEGKEIISTTIKSGLVAILGLAIVYGGLMYLGAQTSSLFPGDIKKTDLLLKISKGVLGNSGSVFIGVAIGLACLTTSIGLISAGAEFFHEISNNKLSYNFNAIVISVVSTLIASFGVDKIIKISVPILSILYPVAITLIAITLMGNLVKNNIIVKASVYTSLIFSIFYALKSSGLKIFFIDKLLNFIPLSTLGFGWLIPTIIAFVIALCFTNNSLGKKIKA